MAEAGSPLTPEHSLADVERWFQAVTTHPGGVMAGAECAEARAAIDRATVGDIIAPSSRQSAGERMTVYAQAYWARLVACLEEEFPTVRSAVGDEAFTQFAVGYVETYPSTSYTLGRLSDRFIAYLRDTALAGTAARDEHAPDLAWSRAVVEIATLERAITQVFDAPGGETLGYLTPADLLAIPPERQSELRLTLLPTVRLLAFEYDVNEYFTAVRQAAQGAEPPAWPARRATYLALSRRGFVVRRNSVSRSEWVLLSAIADGLALGRAIERLSADPQIDLETAAASLGTWFAAWAEAGLFQSLAPVAA